MTKGRKPKPPAEGSSGAKDRILTAVDPSKISLPPRRNDLYAFTAALFTLSGACGLIYQVIWSRLIVLVFGSATHAISTVLGVFFLGLALGSYLAGKNNERFKSPLLFYGLLELGIGIYALLFNPILDLAQYAHHGVFPLLFDSPMALTMARVAIAGLVLLPPTVLMGATVPVVGDFLTRSPDYVGRDYGLIFSLNTFGAAAGSFVSAFFLIPSLGLQATLWIAAAINLGIGVASIWAARGRPLPKKAVSQPSVENSTVTRVEAYACLAAFAVTGFLGLLYEVSWSRALILVFGTSVYAFATMLTTYLIGLALGSMVMGKFVDRIKSPVKAFAAVQLIVGVAVFVSTVAIGMLPDQLVGLFRMDTSWRTVTLVEFIICFGIMFIPAFGSGMLFPLVTRIFMGQRKFNIGRTIADSYAVNTLGCIAGSFVAGFALIPLIGIEMTLLLGAAANMMVAAWLTAFFTEWAAKKRFAAITVIIALAITGVFAMRSWRPLAMNSGIYVYGDALSNMESGVKTFVDSYKMLFYREGPSATVAVVESPRGRFLRVNGKTDGGAVKMGRSDDLTQSFLGLLPLLYLPEAEDALVIGLGTGMTLNAALSNDRTRVDCIEISPAVAEAAAYFKDVTDDAMDSPRVTLKLLDGRTWLDAMPRAYDIIISEPSHPWQTGNANLFTDDFFKASIKRLKEGGVFCQWLPYYRMDEEHFKTLIKTMHLTFPYVNVWVVNTDALVIGSKDPLSLDWPSIKAMSFDTSAKDILGHLGIETFPQLMSFFYLDTPGVDALIKGVSMVNSDDHPIIEYSAPKYLLAKQHGEAFLAILEESKSSRPPLINATALDQLEEIRLTERWKYFEKWGFK
ncbi:MAG: hypothetical protein C0609_04870 [Deltaproteobacteria bacterium]|nr:MAG: hypothetical protein C0609_04870 [Deltaproteobacteria bacterium]